VGLGNRLIFWFGRVTAKSDARRPRSGGARTWLWLAGWVVINLVWSTLMFTIGGMPSRSASRADYNLFQPSATNALRSSLVFAVGTAVGLGVLAAVSRSRRRAER